MVPRAAPITPLRFSTGGMRELAGELRALNERRVVVPLEPVAGSVVHADLAQWPYPQLGILAATLGGLRLSRVVLGKDYGTKPPPHDLKSQCHCERSEAIFARTQRLLRPLQLLAMTAPPSGFLSAARVLSHGPKHLDNIDEAVMRVIRRDTPALALLTRYIGIALDNSLPATAGLQGLIASHVYELATLAFGAPCEGVGADGVGVRAARLRAIKADIVANLADAELSVSAVAARQGVTPRYVHKLFEYDGMTYSGFVVGQRLERVLRMLTDPRCAGHSISTPAFGAGFGDLSYFNRAFRRRYGATPSDLRRYGQSRRSLAALRRTAARGGEGQHGGEE